jgi:acetyl esterase/lipase
MLAKPGRPEYHMAFDNLLPQAPIYPEEAERYAAKALAMSREAAARVQSVWDVPYGSDARQTLDVHLPQGPAPIGAPVIVLLHGGAWTNGYKEWMVLAAPSLVTLPAVMVSASYRLAPEHRFPAPLEDALAIIRWVSGNIARYGGDPARLFVGGHSAGGHLMTLAVLRTDLHTAHGVDVRSIRHCLPLSSQLNLVFDSPAPGSGEERIRTVFLQDPEDARSASPAHLVPGAGVPIFLAYGERDWPRIRASNDMMRSRCAAAGILSGVMELPGKDHFDMHLDLARPDNEWIVQVRRLMTATA